MLCSSVQALWQIIQFVTSCQDHGCLHGSGTLCSIAQKGSRGSCGSGMLCSIAPQALLRYRCNVHCIDSLCVCPVAGRNCIVKFKRIYPVALRAISATVPTAFFVSAWRRLIEDKPTKQQKLQRTSIKNRPKIMKN